MDKFRSFFGKISAETCLKWIILVIVNPKNLNPRLSLMTREYARPYYFQWTCLVYADARQFGIKFRPPQLYFFDSFAPLLQIHDLVHNAYLNCVVAL